VNEEKLFGAIGLAPGLLVAAVGGGGKTSLLRALGAECFAAGARPVVLSTTTHIFSPAPPEETHLCLGEAGRLAARISGRQPWTAPVTLARRRVGETVVPGAPHERKMKLRGFDSEEIEQFRRSEGALLVEADGSRGLPVKAPGPEEPVIPPGTDIVLGVVGFDALGSPLDEDHVFRPGRLSELIGLPAGAPIDAAAVARLAAHPEGLFRGAPGGARRYIIMNKCDKIDSMENLERIGYIISKATLSPGGPADGILFTECLPSGLRVVNRAP
jgi:probable selenium-dependent hydroxylase accessory protein YqeC